MTRTLVGVLLSVALLSIPGDAGGGGHDSFTCANCHISHKGGGDSGPLWNTKNTDDSLPTFALYSSRTFDALGTDIGQPDGASKLCLGCHDGSSGGFSSGSKALFRAADLSRSHPISFTYDSSLASRVRKGGLHDPATTPSGLGGTIAKDLLDGNGKLQCTTCHDVHASGKGPNHLRYDDGRGGDRMCQVCHKI
jgi:hypothetical protein